MFAPATSTITASAPATDHQPDASGPQKTLRYRAANTAESAAVATSASVMAQPVTKLASSSKAWRASAAEPPASGKRETPSAYAAPTASTMSPPTTSATGANPSPWIATTPSARKIPDPMRGYAEAKSPPRPRASRPRTWRRRTTGERD